MANIQNQTQNQLIKVLENFASGHLQLQSFQFGYSFEFAASGGTIFPQLFVEPLPHSYSTKAIFNNYRLIFADLVSKGDRNRDEVLSDMLEIAKDTIAQLHHPDYKFILQDNIPLQDFFDKFDEEVSGYIATISIKTAFDNDRCQIPTDGIGITVTADHNSVIITDDLNANSPVSIGGGGTYTCKPVDNSCQTLNNTLTKAQRDAIQRIAPIKTGQTTSHATGDDGDREDGRAVDFFTLDCNNSFGNTNRFTDKDGLQVYGDNYMIDHLEDLGWFLNTVDTNWATALSEAATDTEASFSDWFIPNIRQAFTLINAEPSGTSNPLNYSPFNKGNYVVSKFYWTSTTRNNFSDRANTLQDGDSNYINNALKTATNRKLLCRKHF